MSRLGVAAVAAAAALLVGATALMVDTAVNGEPQPRQGAVVVAMEDRQGEAGRTWHLRVCVLDEQGQTTDLCTWVQVDHDRWQTRRIGSPHPIPDALLTTPSEGDRS